MDEIEALFEDEPSARQFLGEAIQYALNRQNSGSPAGLVTGWLVVAEVVDGTGEKCLVTNCGDTNNQGLPSWTLEGFLHHLLYDGLGYPIEEEMEEEDDD